MSGKTTCVLAFDLGTGGVKAVLVDRSCRIVAESFEKYETYSRGGVYREQRPDDLLAATARAVRRLSPEKYDVVAVGSSGHSMGRIPVGADGSLLEEFTPIWSDSRGTPYAEEFFGKTDYEKWYSRTGNGSPAGHYAVFKMMCLRAEAPEIYDETAAFLGTKDYINLRLTGALATDRSYASGTGLYDLMNRDYADDYIAVSGIERSKLPKLYEAYETIGCVTKDAAELFGIPAGIPVTAGGVDNGCMALGAGCSVEGDAYCSLGSSAWIAALTCGTGADITTRPYIFAHTVPGISLVHQGIFSSGSTHNWVINTLFPDLADRTDKYAEFDRLAETSPVGANGIMFCPALAGGSAADVSPGMRGGFSGIDLGTTRSDVARSVLEGIALQMRYVSREMPGLGGRLMLTGGGAKGQLQRRILADVFDSEVAVSEVTGSTAALGAAANALYGAGLCDGVSSPGELGKFVGDSLGKVSVISPIKENVAIYRAIYAKYAEFLKTM